jgi:hypothetical protein
MGNGYTRQSEAEISDGQIVFAEPLEDELDAIQAAFNSLTGHSHDGTAGEGPKLPLATSVTGILPKANGGTGTNTDGIPTALGTNNISVTANESFTSLLTGKSTLFKATASNTSNMQANVNGLGSRKILKVTTDSGTVELEVGDVVVDGIYRIDYDQTLDAGTGAWVLMNPTGLLKRIEPKAQTSLNIQQLTGLNSTLSFNSILDKNRAQIYWDSLDGKLKIKIFDSSEVQIGDTLTFDGNNLTKNTSKYLLENNPVAKTSLTVQQSTGDDATLNFDNSSAITRSQIYWDSGDGKLYFQILDSSETLVGLPMIFDGSTLNIGSWNSGQRISNAVLIHELAYNVNTALTDSAWSTWPISLEAYDPDGIVSVSSDQFTPSVNCLIDWRAWSVVSGQGTGTHTVKTRLFNVTDTTITGYGTLHGVGTNGSSGSIVNIGNSEGTSAVVAGKTYRIEYYATGGTAFSARLGLPDGVSTQGNNPTLTIKLRTA